MAQLDLTFSPAFLDNAEEFLIEEGHLAEFFSRMEAILLHNYSCFHYIPDTSKKVLEVFEAYDGPLGLATRFHQLLAKCNEIEVDGNRDQSVFHYLGYGQVLPVENAALKQAFKVKNMALIEFSNKIQSYTCQFFIDEKGTMADTISIDVLPTYNAFVKWANLSIARNFDEIYTKAKHIDPDFRNKAVTDQYKRGEKTAILRCSIEEARQKLLLAFHYNGHHEDFLFFYDQSSSDYPILLFKASRSSVDTHFNFHAYHIQEAELESKYKVSVSDLKDCTEYAIQQI